MTVQTLAAEVSVDPSDIEVIARWLTAEEDLDDAALELALRKVLNPAGQRTARLASACPQCGQLPGPNLVLAGWHPCRCGGHDDVLPDGQRRMRAHSVRAADRSGSGAATRRSGSVGSAR